MPNEMIHITKVDTSRPNKVGVQDGKNRWFGVFDKGLWPRLIEGASLNVEWTPAGDQGQYKNITAILGTASTPNGHSPDAPDGREQRIMRECALKAAVELVSRRTDVQLDTDTVQNWADRFLEWLEGTPF